MIACLCDDDRSDSDDTIHVSLSNTITRQKPTTAGRFGVLQRPQLRALLVIHGCIYHCVILTGAGMCKSIEPTNEVGFFLLLQCSPRFLQNGFSLVDILPETV